MKATGNFTRNSRSLFAGPRSGVDQIKLGRTTSARSRSILVSATRLLAVYGSTSASISTLMVLI